MFNLILVQLGLIACVVISHIGIMDQVEDAVTYHPENYYEFQLVVKRILILAGTVYILLFLKKWITDGYNLEIFFYLLFGMLMLAYPVIYPKHAINKENFIILNTIGLEAKTLWTIAKHWKWNKVMEITLNDKSVMVTFTSGSVDELKFSFYSKSQVNNIKDDIRALARSNKIHLNEA